MPGPLECGGRAAVPANSKNMKSSLIPFITTLAALTAGAHTARAALAVGLTGTGVVRFDTENPGVILGTALFSGLSGDTIVDIDYFPSNGQLFGTASNGRLYTIDPLTGTTTVNTSNGVGALGTVTDADFNPVASRLRVYSTGQANFRLTPGTGVVTGDGTLAYGAGDPSFGLTPDLRGSAYTNSFSGSATTALYSIDSAQDILVAHPAAGAPAFSQLATVGVLTLGGVPVNFGQDVGFDIYYNGGINTAYVTNGNALYGLDLATGVLQSLGTVGGTPITSLAVGLAPVPEPGSALLAASALGLLAMRRSRARA